MRQGRAVSIKAKDVSIKVSDYCWSCSNRLHRMMSSLHVQIIVHILLIMCLAVVVMVLLIPAGDESEKLINRNKNHGKGINQSHFYGEYHSFILISSLIEYFISLLVRSRFSFLSTGAVVLMALGVAD